LSVQRLTEYLDLVDGEIRCNRCSHVLGPASRNYKLGALVRERPLVDGNPQTRDPSIYTDSSVVHREFICPGCGTLLQAEVAVGGAPPQWDVRVED
jgi:acetone carboxylase gamma subunit